MSTDPLVTAVIPTYNCGRFIADAIESVLSQTYSPIQILVIDDGSADETAQVVTRFRGVEYYRKPNGGVSSARNFAVPYIRGDLVAFLDADDVWLPRKTELQVTKMLSDPALALVYSGLYVTDEDLRIQYRMDPAPGAIALRKTLLLEKPYMTGIGSSGMIRRALVEQQVPLFDERFRASQDMTFACSIALRHRVDCVPDPLFLYRQNRGGQQVHRNPAQIEHDMNLFISELDRAQLAANKVPLNRLKANLHLSLGVGYARRRHWMRALRHLVEGGARRPDRVPAAMLARILEKRQR